ncbi:ATP-binding protein [Thalassotalea marina]|uniref:histidine kinase n=1 Tax=Thalassotalea marina TaxID=1673741 RepID=A0A919BKV5_9GAMM|nr:ATP-binding protein [Thalassotalea marina]GHF97044.1 hypothetical protein GCM10017161_26440 [Thalassotalea marina]
MKQSTLATKKQKLRWHHVYYVLALIDIITIVAALSLTQVLMSTYESSVNDNKKMSLSVNEFVKLGYIAQAVNEPGNRIFESRDINAESQALKQNLTWFNTAFKHAKANLNSSFTTEQLVELEHYLEEINSNMNAMVSHTYDIFDAISKNENVRAGGHMSQMDAELYATTHAIGEITQYITEIQNQHFQRQLLRAKQMKQYESVISVVVLVIISIVTLFGHRLGKKLKDNEDKITQSLAEAKQAALAKEQFLANMSHEIRTPMNASLSLLKMIDNQDMSRKDKQYLRLALSSSENLLMIINDILNLSKIESTGITLEQINFDITELINAQVEIYQASNGNEAVNLTFDGSGISQSKLKGDSHRLTQVLNNLLNNAFKFTQAGSISIIATTQTLQEGVKLTIDIQDTGIGIAQDKLDSIFDPFLQADASTTRHYGGTGLGLSISKKICEKMAGDLSVKSEEGHGSTFTISVLMEIADQAFDTRQEQSHNDKPAENLTFEPLNLHLLVAEDNRINQVVIKDALKKMGCTVDLVSNGEEAVKQISSCHQGVLMDCMMPVKDGYQATKEIRELAAPVKDIHIIALTANSLEGDKEKCLAAGMDDYLTKPINFNALHNKLANLVPVESE